MAHVTSARTVSIPTHDVATTDFGLTAEKAGELFRWGQEAAHSFFDAPEQQSYLNSFGKSVGAPASAGELAPVH